MSQAPASPGSKLRSWTRRYPVALVALLVPGGLFALGLFLVRNRPGFEWLSDPAGYPWEFWVIAVFGSVATAAGVLDWSYHRSGRTTLGLKEHHSEVLALA